MATGVFGGHHNFAINLTPKMMCYELYHTFNMLWNISLRYKKNSKYGLIWKYKVEVLKFMMETTHMNETETGSANLQM